MAGDVGTSPEKVVEALQKAGAVAVWGELLLLSEEDEEKECLPTSAGGDLGFLTPHADDPPGQSLHCEKSSLEPCRASSCRPACQPASPSG